MNLSFKRRHGFIHVRGGQFVRVFKTHQVQVGTESSIEKTDREGSRFANPGDLAIEIVKAKRSEDLVGYAYLSGEAIRLHSYEADPDWFSEATAVRIVIEPPRQNADFEELTKQFIRAKFMFDAGVFRYKTQPGESIENMVGALKTMYQYEATDGAEPRGHVFGDISQKKNQVSLHFQPVGQTSELPASRFQIGLAVRSRHVEEREQ